MAAKGTVVINIAGDHSKFDQSLNKVEGGVGKLGSVLQGVGLAVGAAMAAMAVKVGQTLVGSVQKATDFGETLSKSNTIFKEQAGVIEEWASGAAKNFGQSKGAALDAASSFGNMFKQLGIGGEQAAKMSMGITELASDFASFHNADISEVITAQSAAFRGEYDSLQKFLPLINAATVEQKAMAMSGKTATDELTAQDKALAVHQLMLEGAGDALGDFDRTADSAANKQRTLGALWENFQVTIGQKLLPVLNLFLDVVMDHIIPAVEKLAMWVKFGWETITETFKVGDATVMESGESFIGIMQRIGLAALAVKDWVVDELIPALQQLWTDVQPAIEALQHALSVAFNWLVENLPGIIATVIEIIQQLVSWARENLIPVFMEIWTTAQSAFFALVVIIETVVKIAIDLWNRFGEQLVGRLKGVVENLLDVARGLMNVLGGIFDLIKAILTGKWGEAWDAILRILQGFWDAITGLLRALWDAITGLFEVGKGLVSAAWSLLWNSIKTVVQDIFSGVVGWIGDRIREVVGWFQGMPRSLWGAFDGMFDGIKWAFKSAINWVIDWWNGLSFTMPKIDFGPFGSVGGWTVGTPNIPRLYTGAVVRDPMLAVVGDTPGKTAEIITPESLMRQIVREEGSASGGGLQIGSVNVYGADASEVRHELDWLAKTL